MAKMKKLNRIPEKELNKMEIRNLLDAEFKTLAIIMLNELGENLKNTKKDPFRNEGYTNGNKEQFTGNQQ